MTTTPKTKLSFNQKYVLQKAFKKMVRAQSRGDEAVFYKVFNVKDRMILEEIGFVVDTFTPVSYGAPRSWLMRRSLSFRA